MTQEEKQLLLKDLCSRLPYGVKAKCVVPDNEVLYELKYNNGRECFIDINNIDGERVTFLNEEGLIDFWMPIEYIKPYLRPTSSMTEEEIEEYRNLSDEVIGSYGPYHREFIAHCVRLGIKPDNPHECVDDFLNMDAIDWLLAHHFDFRGLIEMGLALEAPEGMYKF